VFAYRSAGKSARAKRAPLLIFSVIPWWLVISVADYNTGVETASTCSSQKRRPPAKHRFALAPGEAWSRHSRPPAKPGAVIPAGRKRESMSLLLFPPCSPCPPWLNRLFFGIVLYISPLAFSPFDPEPQAPLTRPPAKPIGAVIPRSSWNRKAPLRPSSRRSLEPSSPRRISPFFKRGTQGDFIDFRLSDSGPVTRDLSVLDS
jgi:hypothetical protein